MKMLNKNFMLAAVLAASGCFGLKAFAITYGIIDGTKHPAVGALLDTDSNGNLYAFCSGALISPTVMLTAAHCTPTSPNVMVTFDSSVASATSFATGTFIPHPDYNQAQNDPHDIAVIVFNTPIIGIVPADLPTLGLFDTLKQNGILKGTKFTAVGFGGQERNFDGQGQPIIAYQDTREWSVSSFNALNPSWLRLSQNQATGDSGACFGDSGGPNFIGSGTLESNVIAGTTITGDMQCMATNVVYRLDTPSARSFLAQFVSLP